MASWGVFLVATLQDRLLVLALAMLTGTVLVRPVRRFLRLNAPGLLLDRFILRYDGKLNKDKRDTATRLYRGIVLLMMLGFGVGLAWLALSSLHRAWSGAIYIEILWLALMLPISADAGRAYGIDSLLRRKHVAAAAEALQRWRPATALPADAHSIARRSIEALCEDVSRHAVAVALWYVLLGFPAALWVAVVSRLDARIGHESDRYRAFGWAASAMQAVLQWPACRLTALLVVLASVLVPKGRPLRALHIAHRDRKKIQPLHEGWVLASVAGALGVSLAGPRRVADSIRRDAWVGTGTAKADIADLRRAIWLYAMACLLMWLGVMGLLLTVWGR